MAVTARLGAFKTSMLQDVEAGRPIELEALLGAPREIARAKAIPTPALDRLYGVTKLMAESLGLLPYPSGEGQLANGERGGDVVAPPLYPLP
jgi:2-dehydropantoate 2-reductase